MNDRNLRPKLMVVDIAPILKSMAAYPNLLPLLTDIPLSEVIEALLAVSINHKLGKVIEKNQTYMQSVRDDNDLIWYLLEQRLGEKFDTIPVDTVDQELQNLLCELDNRIGKLLPKGWEPGEYTFYDWIGPAQIIVLKDL